MNEKQKKSVNLHLDNHDNLEEADDIIQDLKNSNKPEYINIYWDEWKE